jgi:transposase
VTNFEGRVVMSKKELDQIAVFAQLDKKLLKQKEATFILGLGIRQVKRKLKKYRKDGAKSLSHGNRGRPSNRAMEVEKKEKILNILKGEFEGFGPRFASEKLLELFNIEISGECLRQLMIKNTLWKAKEKKASKHHWRERKHCIGELIQVDGSEHIWFGDKHWILLAFIDDATSKVMYATFIEEESTKSLALATKAYVKQYGRPHTIYVDRASVFSVNHGVNRKKTQYHRMLDDLNINLSLARTPQAKGRVERLFGTLQDRFIKELKLHNILDVEAANDFLQKIYLPSHNERFSVIPASNTDLHRSIDGYDLNTIFCLQESRILKNDNTIVYKDRWFQLDRKQTVILKKNCVITLLISFDGTIQLFLKSTKLAFKSIQKPLPNKTIKKERIVTDTYHKPSPSHPWKGIFRQQVESDISTLRKR